MRGKSRIRLLSVFKYSLVGLLLGWLAYVGTVKMPERVAELVAVPTLPDSDTAAMATVTTSLMKELAQARLIFLDTNNMTINLPPRDVHLQLAARDNGAELPDGQSQALEFWSEAAASGQRPKVLKLVEKLHRRGPTEVGTVLRQEIGAWNAQHGLVAVRDSQAQEDGKSPWAAVALETREYAPERQLSLHSKLLAGEFGFFGLGEAPPQGPWAAVRVEAAAQGTPRPVTKMRRSLPAGEGLMIDVLGNWTSDNGAFDSATIENLCHDPAQYSSETGRPDPACTQSEVLARRVTLPPADEDRQLEISLGAVKEMPVALYKSLGNTTRPVPLGWATCGTSSTGWSDYRRACEKAGWQVYGDVRPIVVLCKEPKDPGDTPQCAIGWNKLRSTEKKRVAPNVHVNLDDGSPLLHLPHNVPNLIGAEGRLAQQLEESKRLGLHPLLGSGRGDAQGLLGAMRNHYAKTVPSTETNVPVTTREITLSIDRELQQTLVTTLSEGGLDFRGGDAVSFVLMDATDRCWAADEKGCSPSETRGVIRAAYAAEIGAGRASVNLDFSRGVWNYLAASAWKRRIGQEADTLVPFAWTSAGSRFAPGSTFKPVTALAGIEHAIRHQNTKLRAAIEGLADPLEAVRPGALAHGATAYVDDGGYIEFQPEDHAQFDEPKCGPKREEAHEEGKGRICNFVKIKAVAPTEGRCSTAPGARFGLCEAIHDSINNYFVAMALALEADRPTHVTEHEGDPAVVTMARRLVSDYFTLLPHEGNLGNIYSRFRGNGFVAMESAADYSADVAKVFMLGQNSYGYNIQTNTAALASVYTAIATGCSADPSLQRIQRGCKPLFAGSVAEREAALSLMQKTLIPGLKAVVEREGTTDAFITNGNRALRSRVYAKTGTADLGQKNTVWFAGWMDPAPNQPEGRRYAFACMVKNVKGRSYGGSVCGPIAQKVLARVAELGL